MASVLYNGSRLIPAPQVSIVKTYNKTEADEKLGTLFSIQLRGQLVPHKGSPSGNGAFHTDELSYPPDDTFTDPFKKLLMKQAAVRQLFANEGRQLIITHCDGTGERFLCHPRVNSISFEEGQWVNTLDYTINLECDVASGTLSGIGITGEDPLLWPYIKSAEENWAVEMNPDVYTWSSGNFTPSHTFNLSHTVSAVGKRAYIAGTLVSGYEPWQHARQYVQSRLGFDLNRAIASGTINVPSGFFGYNHARSEVVDKGTGGYTVTETWLVSSGIALEDFTVTHNTTEDDFLEDVTIEGTITGLEVINYNTIPHRVTLQKYTAANNYWTSVQGQLFSRVQAYYDGSVNLSSTPVQTTVGKNPVLGVISYSYRYNNRFTCITGALNENITIIDNHAPDLYAAIPIIGRAAGPILQDMNTVGTKSKQIIIELRVDPSSCLDYRLPNPVRANVETMITNIYNSIGSYDIFKDEDTESWSIKTGRYTRSVRYTYGNCG